MSKNKYTTKFKINISIHLSKAKWVMLSLCFMLMLFRFDEETIISILKAIKDILHN
ncbi:hypothetical protein [Lacinutrix sp. 5H-3-7-4]|uniref:hypothetical protein n=1 Tax=Lacinutrix sp. (strain 5H-3-7-4) TaxID=983544 RepID=UPI00130524F0|nr:hypothetical protein [Lacinutrix sp. 5H-3-7-4]